MSGPFADSREPPSSTSTWPLQPATDQNEFSAHDAHGVERLLQAPILRPPSRIDGNLFGNGNTIAA